MVFGFKSKGEKLNDAVWDGDEAAVVKLIKSGASPNDPDWGPSMFTAAGRGNKSMMGVLLDNGASLTLRSPNGFTPLGEVIQSHSRKPELVEFLLDRGAKFDTLDPYGYAPIHRATEYSAIEIIRLLIKRGASLSKQDSEGRTPLYLSIARGLPAMVKFYLNEAKCPVEDIGAGGMSPLYFALTLKTPDQGIIKTLLQHGANVEALSSEGGKPLHKAVSIGNEHIVQLLLDHNANPNGRNRDGKTPLHSAAMLKNTDSRTDIVTLLLNRGADVKAVDGKDKTPLHYSLATKLKANADVVRLFVDRGADPNAKDNEGNTPLSMAEKYGNQEIIDLLSNPLVETIRTLSLQETEQGTEEKQKYIDKSSKSQKEIGTDEQERQAQWKKERELKRQAEWNRRKDIQKSGASGQPVWHGSTQSIRINGNSAAEWLQDTQTLQEVLRGDISDDDRVKIAIIDSGIHPMHPQMALVREYKDFVTGNDSEMVDETRHGSTGVDLVTDICPDADVYIARVFRGAEAENETPELIAKAIEYAVDEWHVDVISLASGLKHAHEGMRQAIHKASAKGTIIFAAASNYGSVKGISFPARMYPEYTLMCMFACSGMGKAKNEFNPEPKREFNNFALLGEDVPVYSHLTQKTRNGTSYATFVASAVAGLILDFARQEDVQAEADDLKKLSSVPGMSVVFEIMAKGGRDDNYDCVVPSKLLGNTKISDREKKRKRIWDRISIALENVDRPW
ncbi:Ankyrin-3 [Dactylellina cionopaga]|nr:Ankyrin-3 [Dactylellina cionopaga]